MANWNAYWRPFVTDKGVKSNHLLAGGEGEIRTHEGREALPVFKTGAFNRSATSPAVINQTLSAILSDRCAVLRA